MALCSVIEIPGGHANFSLRVKRCRFSSRDVYGFTGTIFSFIRGGSAFRTLNLAGAAQTTVNDIDDAGHTIGVYMDTSGKQHGFILLRGNNIADIIAFPEADKTQPLGIYNQLNIVGAYTLPNSPAAWRGFLLKGSPL
jgi:hypothetical protein